MTWRLPRRRLGRLGLPLLAKELVEIANRRSTYVLRVLYALTLFGFAGPVGGIAGFLFTGNAIRSLGAPQTFLGGALLTLLAITLMIVARPTRLQPAE